MNCKVKLLWDNEAAVLVLESGSCDALIERVKYAITDFLKIDGVKADYCDLNTAWSVYL